MIEVKHYIDGAWVDAGVDRFHSFDVMTAEPLCEAPIAGAQQVGEAVAAAVVLQPGQTVEASELQAFVTERLRSSRSPSKLVFRDELPYNETGKLLRRLVREDLGGADS